MSQSQVQARIDKKKAIEALWRRGILKWKLDKNQLEMYEFSRDDRHSIVVIGSSRQLGKSFFLTTLAIEECLRQPYTIVKFIAPKVKDIKRIIAPLIREITQDAPKDLIPSYSTQDHIFKFENGSEIQLAGTDNGHAESIRGNKAHLCIIDEAGFCDDLDYIVNSILIPTTTTTNGKIIMASTPSRAPDHPFMDFMRQAQAEDRFIKKTIYDNPRLTEAQIDKIAAAIGGKDSVDFKREYLVEIIVSEDDAVVPEFTPELQKLIIGEVPRPPFFDSYLAMDIGGSDLTVVLFAYYDFRNARVVVEDEIVYGKKMLTDQLAIDIKQKEADLWANRATGEVRPPLLRVADNNNIILLNDLSAKHNLSFTPTLKDNKEAALNNMRMLIKGQKFIIHPRCKTLISHLSGAIWNKARTSYARSVDKGHYDACFTAGNRVLTDTGYKNIEEIAIGDLVLTHNNRFKPVLSVMSKYYEGSLIETKLVGQRKITSTPEHSFYVAETFKNRKGNFTGQLQLKPAEWLSADRIKNHKVYSPNLLQTETQVDVSLEMSFLYGYYVAEGCLGGNGSQIQFAGHRREVNVMSILEKAVKETYGLNVAGTSKRSLRHHVRGQFKPRCTKARYFSTGENGRTVTISNKQLYNELKVLGKSYTKKFPDFISKLNTEQAYYMLLGYLFGDGYFSPEGVKSNTVSPYINDGLDILYRKIGIVRRERIYTNSHNNKAYESSLTMEKSLQLLAYLKSKGDLSYIFEDKLIHPIEYKHKTRRDQAFITATTTEIEGFKGQVYNLEVQDDNSYVVNGAAVHNCDAALYLCRNINFNKNPYPSSYSIMGEADAALIINNQNMTSFERQLVNRIKDSSPFKIKSRTRRY